MDKISEIGHTNGVDLLAGKKNIQNGIHVSIKYQPLALQAEC
jgi:hypothetical protein